MYRSHFNRKDRRYRCICLAPKSGLIAAGLELTLCVIMVSGLTAYMVKESKINIGCWGSFIGVVVNLTSAVIFIYGVIRYNPTLLKPYLVLKIIQVVASAIGVAFAVISLSSFANGNANDVISLRDHSVSLTTSEERQLHMGFRGEYAVEFACTLVIGLTCYLFVNLIFLVIGFKCLKYIQDKLSYDRVNSFTALPQLSRYYDLKAFSTMRTTMPRFCGGEPKMTLPPTPVDTRFDGNDLILKLDLSRPISEQHSKVLSKRDQSSIASSLSRGNISVLDISQRQLRHPKRLPVTQLFEDIQI